MDYRFTLRIFQILLHNSHVLYKNVYRGEMNHYGFHSNFISYLLKNDETNDFNDTKKNFKRSNISSSLPCKMSNSIKLRLLCFWRQRRKTTPIKCPKCNVFYVHMVVLLIIIWRMKLLLMMKIWIVVPFQIFK